jgi:oligopeptide transport system permease protein
MHQYRTLVASAWHLGVLALVAGFALLLPLLGPDPTWIDPGAPTQWPGTWQHWLGTDDLGRDMLARLATGAQLSLCIGLLTAAVSVSVGTLWGLAGALGPPWLDALLLRLLDLLYGLPTFVLVILVTLAFGRSVPSLVLALALFSWPDTARMIRTQALALKGEEFMEACHSLGGGLAGLVLRHLLPNLSSYLMLALTMTVPRALLAESTLSFIGLGIEPPLSSWGSLASEGWYLFRVAPHLLLLPATCILVTLGCLQFMGDDMRQRLLRTSSSSTALG